MKFNEKDKELAEEKRCKYLLSYEEGEILLNGKKVEKYVYKFKIQCLDCGIIQDTTYSNLKKRKSCSNCHNIDYEKIINGTKFKIVKKHKDIVEVDGTLYIGTYQNGEIIESGKVVLPGESILRVQCNYEHCKQEYDVYLYQYKKNNQRCTKCCQEYSNSFAYYIIEELNQDLDKYWDNDVNTENPYCLSKCNNDVEIMLKHPKYENGFFKTICNRFVNAKNKEELCNRFVNAKNKEEFGTGANTRCIDKDGKLLDSIEYKEDWMIPYFVNKSDITHKPTSAERVEMQCPDCGTKVGKRYIYQLYYTEDIGCLCKNRAKAGEKYLHKLFELIGVNHIWQANKNDLDWIKESNEEVVLENGRILRIENCSYDFFLVDKYLYRDGKKYKILVETDDTTHKTGRGDKTAKDMENIDAAKNRAALSNDYYVLRIDIPNISKDIDLAEIIKKSELSKLINLDEVDDDIWNECLTYAYINLLLETADFYNNNKHNMTQIKMAEELGITPNTLRDRLKKLDKMGIVDFKTKKYKRNGKAKVICLNTGEKFNSIVEAEEHFGFEKRSGIGDCCIGRKKTSGKHPITGEKLRWSYYEDYKN